MSLIQVFVFLSLLVTVYLEPPTCKNEPKYVSFNKSVQIIEAEILCFNRTDTGSYIDNICQHPNESLQFIKEDSIITYIDLVVGPDTSCLVLKNLELPATEVCLTISASAQNETSANPATVCIVFNAEGPAIVPDRSERINVAGDITPREISLVVTSSDGISQVNKTGVVPVEFDNDVTIQSIDPPVFIFTPTQPISTNQNVNVSFTVTDGGNPKMVSEGSFRIELLNDTITCTNLTVYIDREFIYGETIFRDLPRETYIERQDSCSSLNGDLTYHLQDNLILALDVFGGFRYIYNQSVTDPASQNLTLEVNSSTGISQTFTLIVLVGSSPAFVDAQYYLVVNETVDIGACFGDILTTHNMFDTFPCTVNNNTDMFEFTYRNTSFCVIKSLFSTGRQNYDIAVAITGGNEFGSMSVVIIVEVKVVINPPVIMLDTELFNVPDSTTAGQVIITFPVVSPTGSEVNVEIIEQVPFTINRGQNEWELTLQTSVVVPSFYTFTIRATNEEGDLSEKTVNVTIVANSPPSCSPDTINTEIPIESTIGQQLLSLSCSDLDGDSLSYSMANDTPSFILDQFQIHSATSSISLSRSLSITNLNDLNFTVTVTDTYGKPVNVHVKFTVKVTNPPVCVGELSISMLETLGSSCKSSPFLCSSPYGLNVEFQHSVAYIRTITLSNNVVNVCGYEEGILPVGISEVEMNITDGFNTITINVNVTIEEVNQHSPEFIGILNGRDTGYVLENVPIGTSVYSFIVTDADGGDFGTFNVEMNSTGIDEIFALEITNNTYTLRTLTSLDVVVVPSYEIVINAVDLGQLSSSFVLTIFVIDVNDVPLCFPYVSFNISVLAVVDTTVGTIQCNETDVNPMYYGIEYQLIELMPFSVPFVIDQYTGVISVFESMSSYMEIINFLVHATSVNLTTEMAVTVYIERDFPPVCNATEISTIFLETANGCSDEKIRCTNDLSSPMTSIETNPRTDDLIIQITNDTASVLDVRICLTQSAKKNVFSDNVIIIVTNDLGQATITWNVEIQDVNEPPMFVKNTYNFFVQETSPVGNTAAVIEVANKAPSGTDDPDTVTVVDLDTADGFNIKNIASTSAKTIKKSTNEEIVDDVHTVPMSYGNLKFTVTDTLDPRYIYRFTMQAEDGGNLTASTTVDFFVQDVNESPTCGVTSLSVQLSLVKSIQEIFISVDCTDPDYDLDFKSLSYTVESPNQDLFAVSPSGSLYLLTKLPRSISQHIVYVTVSDGGEPRLSTTVTVTVNVNRQVSAECTTMITPPNVWIKDACISINNSCTDPTTSDTSTLSYSPSGNYLPDFYVSDGLDGSSEVLKLCYNKTGDGVYQASITVNNGLKEIVLPFNISVVYAGSVPVFKSTAYNVQVLETIPVRSSIATLFAESIGESAGNVSYSIKEVEPVEASSSFIISPDGLLSTLTSLRPYSNQQIKITVQALDDRSLLTSTAMVTVIIQDVNEGPTCSDERPVRVTVVASVSVGYSLYAFKCSDPDVNTEYNTVTPTLSGSSHFELVPDTTEIRTASQLPVTSTPIELEFNITDGTFTVTIPVIITISFEPSTPVLSKGIYDTVSAVLHWSYARPESHLFITRQIIVTGTLSLTYTQVSKDTTSYKMENLEPATPYAFHLIAETTGGTNLTTDLVFVTTRDIPILTNVIIGFTITNRDWSDGMINHESQEYLQLKEETEQNFKLALTQASGLYDIQVLNMRKGSVIIDAVLSIDLNLGTVNDTATTVLDQIYTTNLNNLSVTDGNVYPGDQYITAPSLHLKSGNLNSILEGEVVEFICGFRFVSLDDAQKPAVKWYLDDSLLINTHTSLIKFTNTVNSDDKFRYTYNLKLDKAGKSHSGILKCKVTSPTESTITQEITTTVTIIPKPVAMLWPLSPFLKRGESVNLTCTSIPLFGVTFSWHAGNNNDAISGATTNRYTVTMTDHDISIYCQATNVAGFSDSQKATIHHIPSTGLNLPCASSVDARNTTWPAIPADTTVKLGCGDRYEGYSARTCSDSGQWKSPDYSNCKLVDLILLKTKTDDVMGGKQVVTPEETLETLVALTDDGKSLSAGDVQVSIQILQSIVNINNDTIDKPIKKDELENFAFSASNVLDADDEEWRTLSDQGKSGLPLMLKTIDDMAQLTSSRLENKEPITAATPKMVIEVGISSSLNDIEFPRPKETYPPWMSESTNKVLLSKDALKKYFTDDKEVGYNVIVYNDINNLLEDMVLLPEKTVDSTLDINTKIIAFSINPRPDVLDPPISLSFQQLSDNYSNPSCVFLDLKPPYQYNGRWSTDGCTTEVSESNPNVTICKCNHLTNFAILMSPGKAPEVHETILSYISLVGCVISLVCLLLTIGVYAYLWRYVKSDKSIILMNLCCTLIVAYALFLGGVQQTAIKAVCQTISVLLHFFYLVVFHLMLAEGVEIFISLVYVFATRSRLKWILLCSWGIPAVIVAVSVGATQLEGYGNDKFCWLTMDSGLLWAFVGPVLAIILVNLIIMIKVLTIMFSTMKMVTKTMKERGRTGLKALCVLLPIMGLTWVFGVFSVNEDAIMFQYLFAVFNSLQGVFIFIFHCLMCRQIQDGIKMKRRRYRAKSVDSGTTKTFTQVPLSTNRTQSTSETGGITNDLDKKTNPFLEADRQVHELAQKLAKVDNNNIQRKALNKNIAIPEPNVGYSERFIFDVDIDDVIDEDPIPEIPVNAALPDDMYVPLSTISNKKLGDNKQFEAVRSADDFNKKSSSQASSSSNRSGERPMSSEGYDHLHQSARAETGYRDYTKLDKNPKITGPGYVVFDGPSQPIQRKVQSIEDNSKQQTGYFPDTSQSVPAVKRDPSPVWHPEQPKPSVAPKTKPKPRTVDVEDDKIQNIEKAYEAVDAYYVGPQSTPAPAKNYPPTDKWTKMKESQMRKQQQQQQQQQQQPQFREIPQGRRIQSHEDISNYRQYDNRGHPVSRQAPRNDRGWQDPRRAYQY